MKRLIIIAGVVAIGAIVLAGCGWIGTDEGLFKQSEEEAIKAGLVDIIISNLNYQETTP